MGSSNGYRAKKNNLLVTKIHVATKAAKFQNKISQRQVRSVVLEGKACIMTRSECDSAVGGGGMPDPLGMMPMPKTSPTRWAKLSQERQQQATLCHVLSSPI